MKISAQLSNVKTIEELRELCRNQQAGIEALLDQNKCYTSFIRLHKKLTGLPDSADSVKTLAQIFFPEKIFTEILKEYMFSVYDKALALDKEYEEQNDGQQKWMTELGILLEKCHNEIISKKKEELKEAAKKENSPALEEAVSKLCSQDEYFQKHRKNYQEIEIDVKKDKNLEKEYDFKKPFAKHFGKKYIVISDKHYGLEFDFKDLFIALLHNRRKLHKKFEYGITKDKIENTNIALVEIVVPYFEQYQHEIPLGWYNPKDKTIFVEYKNLMNAATCIKDKWQKNKLLRKEFKNCPLNEIIEKNFVRTAVHELGHQANDLSYYCQEHCSWIGMDLERFSKLCELIYGEAEYYSLYRILESIENKNHQKANECIKEEFLSFIENNKKQYKINFNNLRKSPEDELAKLTRQEIRYIATQIMEKFEEEKKELIRTGFESVEGSGIYNRKKDLKRYQEMQASTALTQNTKNQLKRYRQRYKKIYEKIYGSK